MAASRGKNYGPDELKQLCYSVLHVSQDPCVGARLRAQRFWDRVTEHYEKHKPKGSKLRDRKSLEGKWSDIKHDVSKFIGCYQQVEDLQVSGTNADDTLLKAKELFKQNHPKDRAFAYECCFWILKDCPQWGNPADDMAKGKGKKSRSDQVDVGYSSPSPILRDNGESNESADCREVDDAPKFVPSELRKRPLGNRRAKEEHKRLKIEQEAMKISADAQKEMAAANRDRVSKLQNNSLMKLLTLPTDNMQPELAAFVCQWKMEEAMKLKLRMQSSISASIQTGNAAHVSVPSPPPPFESVPSEPCDSTPIATEERANTLERV